MKIFPDEIQVAIISDWSRSICSQAKIQKSGVLYATHLSFIFFLKFLLFLRLFRFRRIYTDFRQVLLKKQTGLMKASLV